MHISLESCTSDVQSLRYDTWGNKMGLLLLNIMGIGNMCHVNQDLMFPQHLSDYIYELASKILFLSLYFGYFFEFR